MEETYEIEHQEAQQRFVLLAEGMECELTYKRFGDVIVFDHTGVPPQLQHRGLANDLAEAALGFAREWNLQVDPQCRFMAVYIERHRQWQDLLKKPKLSHPPHPLAGGTR
jgi:predicted GNAT family acetyltransferase